MTTILLVEDDSEHAEIVALRLGEDGFRVARAHTGPAAVSAVENGDAIDALVVDFQMPAMNGLDLLAEIRRRGFDHPFILLTAHGGEEVAVGALRGGASDYIVKDIDLDYLNLLRPTIERSIEKLHFLRESRTLAKALESTLAAVAITSPQGLVEYVNPAFENITGYPRGHLLGKMLALPEINPSLDEMPQEIHDALLAGNSWQGELRSERRDGKSFVVDLAVSPIVSPAGTIANVLWIQHNVTERKLLEERVKEANRELQALAIKDAVTGAYNRRYLETALPNEVSRAKRYRLPLSVLMLDVDRFKDINDAHGHPFGDEVLKTLITLIRQATREPDIITRYGGEEFCLVLPNTDRDGSRLMGERIRGVIEEHRFEQGSASCNATVSIGAATLGDTEAPETPQTEDASALLDRADRALYRAKQLGRNRVCVWVDVASD